MIVFESIGFYHKTWNLDIMFFRGHEFRLRACLVFMLENYFGGVRLFISPVSAELSLNVFFFHDSVTSNNVNNVLALMTMMQHLYAYKIQGLAGLRVVEIISF